MTQEFSLGFLKELEKEKVLEVLYRDEVVQKREDDRIREMKIKTGDWFFEERAKKFPAAGKHETTGAKLLKSYQKLSNISVVPPTPPPFSDTTSGLNSMDLSQSKGFTKSVENLFFSLTTHIKKISKSQTDMTAPGFHLTAEYGQHGEWRKERRSQSDTAIDIANRITNAPCLRDLINKAKEEEVCGKSKQEEESDLTSNTIFSGGMKHGSISSVNSTCAEAANVTGEIQLAIVYNFKTSALEICITACRNLAYGEERKKKCNPYVKSYLLPDKSQSKLKTAVKKNTVDPSFHETLKYKIHCSQLQTRMLRISVWHAGTLKRKVFLGEVLIPFDSWDFEDISMRSFSWYRLTAKMDKCEDGVMQYNGELIIRAKFVIPSQCNRFQHEDEELLSRGMEDKVVVMGQLNLLVLCARNLPLRSDGTLNSFVKSELILPNNRELRQKSPVQKKQTCPEWRHTFVFHNVTQAELEDAFLDLSVWDQTSFGSDRFLGSARLGSREPNSMGEASTQYRLLWQRVLNRPNEWTDESLILHSRMGDAKKHFP
ncbi:synaptotagmin-like protein 3 isoform X3 [Rhinatrema bivittatum]|uniref:synaptotagmin-like protein 3 isoform X3 n=1 Tax=Rhinatrema bivittatum TaxID=194408 RepID=UPI0011296996|nr:synaptotagmin-like protein 3 isoform X3 [Rhinatrema bivittatum]